MNIDELMQMLPSERHTVSIVPRRRGAYRPRRVWTENELLTHLRSGNLRTTGTLQRYHADHKHAPAPYDYVKAFGRWSVAVERAFGSQPPFPISATPPNDPDYIVKCCELYGVSSQRGYLAVRRAHRDVVPSSRQVRRVWGGFGNLFYACKRQSAKRTLGEYLRLEHKMGRIPSALECRAAGLDLTPLRKIMGSKWDIDDLLAYRREVDGTSGGDKRIFSDTPLGSAVPTVAPV